MNKTALSKRSNGSGGLLGAVRRLLLGEVDEMGEEVRDYTREVLVDAVRTGAAEAGEILLGRSVVIDVESEPVALESPKVSRPKKKTVVKRKPSHESQ